MSEGHAIDVFGIKNFPLRHHYPVLNCNVNVCVCVRARVCMHAYVYIHFPHLHVQTWHAMTCPSDVVQQTTTMCCARAEHAHTRARGGEAQGREGEKITAHRSHCCSSADLTICRRTNAAISSQLRPSRFTNKIQLSSISLWRVAD